MNKIQFEGDLNLISERQLQFISSVLEKRGFCEAKAIVEPVCKPGDNYGANVKRITVEKDGAIFKAIAKIAPSNEMMRNAIQIGVLFQNEYLMYNEVLPKFSKIEEKAGIVDDDKLKYAVCFGGQMDDLHEVILLEDLKESSFAMLDRFKSLSDEDIKLILKDLAKLHSLSYALRNQEPEKFTAYKEKLCNLAELFANVPELNMFFVQIENTLLSQIQNEKYTKVVKGIVSGMAANMVKLSEVDRDARYSIIQQGDTWTNNVMFRKKDENQRECCIIDYQQSRIISPVGDLLYMIFNCTDYVTRTQHFQKWIDYYYIHLDKYLSNYGFKARDVYPRDQIDVDLKRHGKVSLAQSILLSLVLLRESADAEKLQEAVQKGLKLEDMVGEMEAAMNVQKLVEYKARIEGLVDSHLELGLV